MLSFIYNLTIKPIELLVELVFIALFRLSYENSGIAIIGVSLIVQFLTLPLYNKSDAMQEKERHKQKEMEGWVKHIRKSFKGDERFMILSTYYRQQNYKPIHALRGSVSLLLQVPFFIAAYNFLSKLSLLNGSSFLIFNDLGKPDGLIHVAGFTLNLLPILMTAINILSGAIYTKGFTVKEKVQLYAMAGLFLILLYNCPAGLVLYWTLNNVFSLLKNIFTKVFKQPKKILAYLFSIGSILVFVFMFSKDFLRSAVRVCLVLGFVALCQIPLISILFPNKNREVRVIDNKLFVLCCCVLSVLLGLVIPFSVISASPTEFISDSYGPLYLALNTFSISIGFFAVWFSVFYFMMPDKIKNVFTYVLFALLGVCLVDFLFFGRKLGMISPYLTFDEDIFFSKKVLLINGLTVLLTISVFTLLLKKKESMVKVFLEIVFISGLLFSVYNFFVVGSAIKDVPENSISESNDNSLKPLKLSKNGKNVVVIMIDRAINGFAPFIFEEKPELKESFSGFTYYPNTLAYGPSTNYGTPGIFGGYEYSPYEMDKRVDELLVTKHNEALKVMPKLFGENGFKVSVCDPPYAGYKWDPDLSIYDGMENVSAYITKGAFTDKFGKLFSEAYEEVQKRNFFWYGVMKCLPVCLQTFFYDDGFYFSSFGSQIGHSFISAYTTLISMNEMTEISDEAEDNLLLFQNDTTHQPTLLKTPEYCLDIDLNKNSADFTDKTLSDGTVCRMDTLDKVELYHTNMATYMALANWFDYLKENGVWDNTRIIIVSDHGHSLEQFDYMVLSNGVDVQTFNAILMVKDFESSGDIETNNHFMTVGDVVSFAVEDLFDNPCNPYTGKEIRKPGITNSVIISTAHNSILAKNHGNIFDNADGIWYEVKDNIFDESNWTELK